MSNTKRQRHVALLVEDDPDMAAEMIELLRLFDHECIHASTKAEAEPLIEEGNFCYALLDLEIKAEADSIRPRVEAGESVLGLLRTRYPCRNEQDEHFLQALMVSGHSGIEHVTRSFKQRADDFVAKPIGNNPTPFQSKLEEALRKSGRQRHEDCASLTQRARGEAMPEVSPPRLVITGRQRERRLEVAFGDARCGLRVASLVLLLQLVEARLRNPEGWVHKIDLGAKDEQGWQGMTRLKTDLQPAGSKLIENDGGGGYRLHPDVELGAIDTNRLASVADARINRLAEAIAALRQAR